MANKVAIVTGARRGIGRSISIELSKIGFNILVVDLERDSNAEATLTDIQSSGVAAAFCAADISAISAAESILSASAELPGRLACLVNNAGVTSLVRGDMLELTAASYDRVMATNLRGSFFLSQAFAKRLLANQSRTAPGEFRSIINITSANAEFLGVERADYTLSKTALSMMTRLFAARLAKHLVNVYEIRPGMIRTDMTAPMAARYDQVLQSGAIPFDRWGEPEDVGRAVANSFGSMAGSACGCRHDRWTNHSGHYLRSSSVLRGWSSETLATPMCPIVTSTSFRKSSIIRATPDSPAAPSP
jgi:3-oxoacyl-[acyl-carrier protein] reductase